MSSGATCGLPAHIDSQIFHRGLLAGGCYVSDALFGTFETETAWQTERANGVHVPGRMAAETPAAT